MKSNISRSVLIPAIVHELIATEVQNHIGADRYAAIKAEDEHPQFVEIIVGIEGVSNGKVMLLTDEYDGRVFDQSNREQKDQGDQKKEWARGAIEQLARALNYNMPPLVEGHSRPRGTLGEIHSGFFEEREKKATALGIGYIRDAPARTRINQGELDVASIEADILLAWNEEKGVYDVEELRRVNAVALWNSEKNMPGFEGAGIAAVINELQEAVTLETVTPKGDDTMNLEGKSPSDVFTRQQLLNDPVVKVIVSEAHQNLNSRLDDMKVELEKATGKIKSLEGEAKTKDEKLKAMGMTANSARILTLLETKVAALKASEKEKGTMLSALKKQVRVDDPEISDSDLDKLVREAVDSEYGQLEQYRKIWGKPANAGNTGPAEEEGGEEDNRDEFLKANRLDKDGNPLPKEKAA